MTMTIDVCYYYADEEETQYVFDEEEMIRQLEDKIEQLKNKFGSS